MSETINGIQFRDAVISAAENITAHRKDVDELNVFPVPDGDTGTNMVREETPELFFRCFSEELQRALRALKRPTGLSLPPRSKAVWIRHIRRL